MQKLKKLFPHILFSYGEPLGIHERIIDSLQARILEKQQPKHEASVLLIGRGSSDPAVKRDLAEIAARLRMKYNYQTVDTCFLYGMGPSFDDWLQQEKRGSIKFLLCRISYLQVFYGKALQNDYKGYQTTTWCYVKAWVMTSM
ncbi:hypothetical protein OL548_31595 [Lysinibacillus sp. MHQ-1]|nr:hypothetical protein OL548_31595 [Lysinibacillus sp. MHQ-1]